MEIELERAAERASQQKRERPLTADFEKESRNMDDDKFNRLLEKISSMAVSFAEVANSVKQNSMDIEDHEKRLRGIERWKHGLTPVLAAGTFLLGVVVSKVTNLFFGI